MLNHTAGGMMAADSKAARRPGVFAPVPDYEMLARNAPPSRGNAIDPNRISR